jgi:hypothetical protein
LAQCLSISIKKILFRILYSFFNFFVEEIVLKIGAPRKILSDRGKTILGKIIRGDI